MDFIVEPIEYRVAGERIVGDLYLPRLSRISSAVLVAGPMTSVKEQVTGMYAQSLAKRGIAALAIDHRYYGASDGHPRYYEYAKHKIEDLCAGLDALSRHPGIDDARIGLVGVCLGAGYAAWAATDAPLVKALVCIAGYYRDADAIRAADPAGFDRKVEEGAAARSRYERTGAVSTIPAAAIEGDAAMQTPDTVDYYTRRAAVSNYRNAFAVMSREHFLPFDVQSAAPLLRVPTLMVHSEQALSPTWARKFHAAISAPKRLAWISSRGQTDIYDDPVIVAAACDLAAAHLHEVLDSRHFGATADPSDPDAAPSAISAP